MCLKDFYQLPRQVDEKQICWQDQPRLQMFIHQLSAERSEYQLIIYLFSQLRDNPTDIKLITIWQCWLYKCCQKVADERYNRLNPFLPNSYTIEDLFQDCCSLITNPVDFFSKFDINSSLSLKIWSVKKIKNIWLNKIRKDTGDPNIGITNLGLAVGSSRKKWLEIATNDNEKAQYKILYQCVDELRNSTDLSCDQWKDQEFREISDRYNQLIGNMRELTGTEIKKILDNIGGRIRLLRQPREISRDATFDHKDGEISYFPDRIESFESSYLEMLILKEERLELAEKINNILCDYNERKQQILYLYFCCKLNQQEVANRLNINQSTVGRTIGNLGDRIISLMASQDINLTSENMIVIFDLIRNSLRTINETRFVVGL
ncbi:MAG TPA: sigma-70 family RNA polymerase sigma factor [Allocoleopsis sp.]